MAEIGISVAAKAAEYTVDPIATRVEYMWNYKSNFENLEKQVQKLQDRKDMVQHSVDEAKRNGEEIEQHVDNWLENVKKIIDEAMEIIEDGKQANMGCFKRWCLDLKQHYQRSKKAVVKANEASELETGGKFDKVSYRTPPKEIWHPSTKPFEDFQSRRSIVPDVLTELCNSNVNMVGVYGMGGIGKTTLSKEVGKRAEEQRLFDVVVFVEVSEKPDIRKIQGTIADKLGLAFREETESGRARTLCERLKKESKILVILDNIWKGIDLETVGIPLGDEHRECPCLEQLNLQTSASDVAKRCGGLPIAIVTIAKALKDKQEDVCRNALGELKRPSSENLGEAYACIRLSYHHLESDELKSTFLLCCTIAFTSNASIENLLRYGWSLNLFRMIYTMEEARVRVNALLRKLKDSSLLLDSGDSRRFSIHDVVCKVGRVIAFKDYNQSIIIDGIIPREWKDGNILKYCTSISLHDIIELPNKELNCPLLKFLYMQGKNKHSKIPDNFFMSMPNLRVLHLIGLELSPLPSSLLCLVNLQTLCLNCSWLRDIGFLLDMKDLEILVLSCDTIEQLPTEIGQLTQLKVLDLSECYNLEVIPPSIISKLTQLEELYLNYKSGKWQVEGVLDNQSSNASLDELTCLSQLTTLYIYIQDTKMVRKGLFSQQLQRYNIFIGVGLQDPRSKYGTSRTMRVQADADILLEDGVIMQWTGIEELYLEGRLGVKNVLYELDNNGFSKLNHLDIKNNSELLFIVDSSKKWELPCDAFPHLETLYLENLMSLEKIFHGQLTPNSFHRLRITKVESCDNLQNIISFSVAKHLLQVEEIDVRNCKNMEEIFNVGRRNDVKSNDRIVLYQLHTLYLGYLPKLRSICSQVEEVAGNTSSEIDTLIPLFDGKVEFPNLKTLELVDVNVEKIWHHQLLIMSSCIQNLTRLTVQCCHNFKYLFSSSTLQSFVQLQDMKIVDCKVMQEMIKVDDLKNNFELPSLKMLWIERCPEMKTLIFNDKVSFPNLEEVQIFVMENLEEIIRIDDLENNVEFPFLKKLNIHWCPKMKAVILNDKVSIPNLEEVQISSMVNLEMIWQNQLTNDSMEAEYCPKLCKVEVTGCSSLKNLFPQSIASNLLQLKDLSMINCGIEEVVAKEGAEDVAVRT